MKFFFCLHILHWATESEKYIILTLFYDKNYVNLSNLKFHPQCHTKSSFFLKSPICVIDYHVTSFQHTDVPNSSILKYYWFLWYLIPGTDVLLILMWPLSSMLMCYWLSCDLIPANWCVIDSHVTSFQHTDVLLILMWPHSSILICYWFSCRVASRNLHLWALCLIT